MNMTKEKNKISCYENKEKYRIITGPESTAAKTLDGVYFYMITKI